MKASEHEMKRDKKGKARMRKRGNKGTGKKRERRIQKDN
jgi:hypothetical protein